MVCPNYNDAVSANITAFINRLTALFRSNDFSRKRVFALVVSGYSGSDIVSGQVIGAMAAIVALLVPQIIKSIVAIVEILPGRMEDLTVWLTDTLKSTKYPQLASNVDSAIQSAYDFLMKWASSHIMPGVGSYMAKISEGVLITLRTFLNIIIGIVVCLYFLNGKERFKAEAKKIIISVFRRERADAIFDFGNFSNKTFGGFINGKIIDSLIIGLICYVFML